MSSMGKTITAIIIIILIILGVWWYMSSGAPATPVPAPATSTTASTQQPVAEVAPNPTILTTGATDNSDAALQSDLKAVGAESQNLTTDSSAIDGSFTNNSSQSAYEAQ